MDKPVPSLAHLIAADLTPQAFAKLLLDEISAQHSTLTRKEAMAEAIRQLRELGQSVPDAAAVPGALTIDRDQPTVQTSGPGQ